MFGKPKINLYFYKSVYFKKFDRRVVEEIGIVPILKKVYLFIIIFLI